VKKVLIASLVALFMFAAVACFAGEKCAKAGAACCPLGQAKAAQTSATDKAPAADPHAACMAQADTKAMTATDDKGAVTEAPVSQPATAVATQAVAKDEKVMEGACPDVSDRSQLETFHELMHPMHMALEDQDYATIRTGMPKLAEASKGVAAYKCPASDKCSPDCVKKFDEKKAMFLKSVDELNAACKTDDNAKVDATFGVMHEAYVGFASMCAHPTATEKIEKTEATETTK
jgi:hypothetical protein